VLQYLWNGPYVIVQVDNNQQVADSNRADTIAVAANTVQSDAQELPPGSTSSGTLAAGQAIYYRVDTQPGQVTEINLSSDTASAINELYASSQVLPTRGSYDFAYSNPTAANQQILIPADSAADTYYVMIYGRESPGTQSYTVSAVVPAFSVAGVDLPQVGNTGPVTFKINGAGLDSSASFQLTDAQGTVYNTTQQVWLDSTSALATFNLAGAAAGPASLTVTDGGASLTAADATTIVAGAAGKLSLNLIAPGALRPDRLGTWTVQYSNTGLADLPVPFLLFALPGADFLSTSPQGNNLGNYVFLMGIPRGDFYDLLRPGESGQMTFYGTLPGSAKALLTAIDPNASILSQIHLANAPADLGTNYAQLFSSLQSQLAMLALGPVRYHGVTCVNGVWNLGSLPSLVGAPSSRGAVPDEAAGGRSGGSGSDSPASTPGDPTTHVIIDASSNYSGARQAGETDPDISGAAEDGLHMAQYCANVANADVHVVADAQQWGGSNGSSVVSALQNDGIGVNTNNSLSGFLNTLNSANIQPGDTLLICLDGHMDASGTFYFSNGDSISAGALAAVVNSYQPGQVGYVLDCCHAGAATDLEGPNSFVAYATTAKGTAQGTDQGGYFTTDLLSHNPGIDMSWPDAAAAASQQAAQQSSQSYGGEFCPQKPQAPYVGSESTFGTQKDPLDPWTDSEDSDDNDWNLDWSDSDDDTQQVIDDVDDGYGPSVTPDTDIVSSEDPNNLVGPAGYGANNYVPGGTNFGYTIDFQNSPSATAAAQTVNVTLPLDPSLDPRSVRLGSFGFGSTFVAVPQNQTYYQTQLDLTATCGVYVDVTAAVDVADATISWQFTTIDPATGLPTTNPLQGFLPPDDGSGSGEGFVTFYAAPQANLPSNTAINEQASVVFDTNPAIATNVYGNIFDSAPPTSSDNALPAWSPATFTVSWSGTDAGSGVASYSVFVSDNGGTPTLWQNDTTATSAQFTGADGHTYSFSCTATDNVGNVETLPVSAQATTTVDTVAPTSSVQPLPVLSPPSFTVSWSGTDAQSGVASYKVYVSDDGGPYGLWQSDTTQTSAAFAGQLGHTYRFYSVATDHVGNEEVKNEPAEATTQIFNQNPSTMTVASDHPSGSAYGQAVTFSATIGLMGLSETTSYGSVSFLDGGTTLGSGTWNPAVGAFTYTTSALSLGSHTITAVFTPTNSTALFASGGDLTQAVGQVATTTSIAASPDPAAANQRVGLTVTVASPSGIPQGTVTVKAGGTTVGSGTLDQNGKFTCSASFKKAGSYSIVASYVPATANTKAPKTNFLASSASLMEQVGASAAVPTTLAIIASATPSAAGQSLSYTVTVAPLSGSGSPSGTVTLTEGKTVLGAGTLAGGAATIPVSSLTKVALHTIVATYTPASGTSYGASTATFVQRVVLGTSTTVLTASVDPAVFGQSVTFTATVTGNGGTPTGSVTFMDGTKALGKAKPLTAGVASLTISALAVGPDPITAVYKGDASFSGSGGGLTEVVNQDATTTSVTSSLNPSNYGQKVTLTATVIAVGPGSGVPTGTVTFEDNGTPLGMPVKLDRTGTATLKNIATLTAGAHTITAVYSGDSNFLTSTSTGTGVVIQVVNPAAHVVLASSPAAAAVAPPAHNAGSHPLSSPSSSVLAPPLASSVGRSSVELRLHDLALSALLGATSGQ
jgi:hypothetical protein